MAYFSSEGIIGYLPLYRIPGRDFRQKRFRYVDITPDIVKIDQIDNGSQGGYEFIPLKVDFIDIPVRGSCEFRLGQSVFDLGNLILKVFLPALQKLKPDLCRSPVSVPLKI